MASRDSAAESPMLGDCGQVEAEEIIRRMSQSRFTLSYDSLSEDCVTPVAQVRGTLENLDESAVLARLEAFSAIPAVALVDEHLATRKGFHVVTTTPVV